MTDHPSVVLNWSQLLIAGHVGLMRNASNVTRGIRDQRGHSENQWELHVLAAQAEMAAAIYLNLHWDGAIGDFAARDVGGLVDVRSTTKSHHCLLLHPADIDDVPYVLAVVEPPRVTFKGWIFAREGKLQSFWKDPVGGRPAYFFPDHGLWPMPALFDWVSEARIGSQTILVAAE